MSERKPVEDRMKKQISRVAGKLHGGLPVPRQRYNPSDTSARPSAPPAPRTIEEMKIGSKPKFDVYKEMNMLAPDDINEKVMAAADELFPRAGFSLGILAADRNDHPSNYIDRYVHDRPDFAEVASYVRKRTEVMVRTRPNTVMVPESEVDPADLRNEE